MGGSLNGCNNCCSNTDGDAEFYDDPANNDGKSGINNQNKKNKVSRQGLVGRSGEFRQSKNGMTKPILKQIDLSSFSFDDIEKIIKIQALMKAYI